MSRRPHPQVFISHSARDKDVARQLAQSLVEEGLDIWIDEREIAPGDSIVARIEDGLRSSDYLAVLISRNSLESPWVNQEIEAALHRASGNDDYPPIIPIRIDDSPLPPLLASRMWVDLRTGDFAAAAHSIAQAARAAPVVGTSSPAVTDVIDSNKLASALAAERGESRGTEFAITTTLGVLTLIATVVAAVSGLYTEFWKGPRVYYDVRSDSVVLPPGADEKKVLELLDEAGVAPTVVRTRIVNNGNRATGEVRVGIDTKGKILYSRANFNPLSPPVWVTAKSDALRQGDSNARLDFRQLVPGRSLGLELGLRPRDAEYTVDVVSDGVLAERVPDIEALERQSLWETLRTPLFVLVGGIVLSGVVGTAIAARRNSRFREMVLAVTKVFFPAMGRVLELILGR